MFDAFDLPDAQRHPPAPSFFVGAGKQQSRGSTVTPGTSPSPAVASLSSSSTQEGALSVFCLHQRRAFLVDSGADVSVYPASASQKKRCPTSSILQEANSSSIPSFCSRAVHLSLPGLNIVHRFILDDVRKPILGSDFFRANNLLIDISCCCRRCQSSPRSVSPGSLRPSLCGRHLRCWLVQVQDRRGGFCRVPRSYIYISRLQFIISKAWGLPYGSYIWTPHLCQSPAPLRRQAGRCQG